MKGKGRVSGFRKLLFCGYGGFSLRNLWVFRCDVMLCCWFSVSLIENELVEKGREEMAKHRERRKAEHRVLENF